MFVRIKKSRLAAQSRHVSDYSVRVLVVKSFRVDGKPRQKVIKYLGSTRASHLKTLPNAQAFIHEMQKIIRSSGFDPRDVAKLNVGVIRCILHLHHRGGLLGKF
jgi:hypothetical protein